MLRFLIRFLQFQHQGNKTNLQWHLTKTTLMFLLQEEQDLEGRGLLQEGIKTPISLQINLLQEVILSLEQDKVLTQQGLPIMQQIDLEIENKYKIHLQNMISMILPRIRQKQERCLLEIQMRLLKLNLLNHHSQIILKSKMLTLNSNR